MKEKIENLKQDFEHIYEYLNGIELSHVKEKKIHVQLDRLENVIEELETLNEDLL